FRVRVSADDVRRPKPAPDAYLIALDRLRIGPTAAVAFEDSASGLEAAGAAGLPVLALRHSFNLEQDLSRAVAQFDSLCDSSTIVETIESLLIPAPA
ncbi:MAG: HAD-IA family hydrolase, partial [Acidobacteria bacterium]|nr:HAD-IA family hydrolase [Acidobacteriota bacterium]